MKCSSSRSLRRRRLHKLGEHRGRAARRRAAVLRFPLEHDGRFEYGVGTGDAPNLVPLLDRAILNGARPLEVSADAAYTSSENIGAVQRVGAQPFFDFRSNMTGASSPLLASLLNRHAADRMLYEEHYHRRSNVESVIFMVKKRFGGHLVSRRPRTQYVEIVLKAISHNIACLVYAMHRHGIAPHFWTLAQRLTASEPAIVIPELPALIHDAMEMPQ